jgi:hypothetical protein
MGTGIDTYGLLWKWPVGGNCQVPDNTDVEASGDKSLLEGELDKGSHPVAVVGMGQSEWAGADLGRRHGGLQPVQTVCGSLREEDD